MLIGNKCDLTGQSAEISDYQGFRHITVSAKQEMGVQGLIKMRLQRMQDFTLRKIHLLREHVI